MKQVCENKSELLVHSQQVHRQEAKPHKCSVCQKGFANSSYLSQHQRIHAGLKPHKCVVCGRAFTQLCHLQQHLRTHTGEKPYRCRHGGCEKAFSQLSNLQSHMRTHMTDRPFKCNSCYKCFADESALRDHIPKHSATKHLKTHICKLCGKSYTQETYLAGHLLKHDKGLVRGGGEGRGVRGGRGLVISVPTISQHDGSKADQPLALTSPDLGDFSSSSLGDNLAHTPLTPLPLPLAPPGGDLKPTFSLPHNAPSAFYPLMTSSVAMPTSSNIANNTLLSRYNGPSFGGGNGSSSCSLTPSPTPCRLPQNLPLNIYDLVKREHVPDYHPLAPSHHITPARPLDSTNLFKFDNMQNFSPMNPALSFSHFEGDYAGGLDLLRKRGDLC